MAREDIIHQTGWHLSAWRVRAYSLLDAIGIPHENSYLEGPSWDGSVLHTRLIQTHALLHEVGHWVVADPKRRKLPNYGLGADPDYGASPKDPRVPRAVSLQKATTEEYSASFAGILFSIRLGFDPEAAMDLVAVSEVYHRHYAQLRKLEALKATPAFYPEALQSYPTVPVDPTYRGWFILANGGRYAETLGKTAKRPP